MNATVPFAINGRFLTQSATGVQRYAMNVVREMDRAMVGNESAPIIVPPHATDPGLAKVPVVAHGRLQGHAWEQLSLPTAFSGRLLNLCNTAPALKRDQIICIHDANIFAAPESYSPRFRMLYRSLQPYLARRAARIVTVSHAAARQLERYLPVRVEDIAVLPNGHEHALAWDPSKAQIAPSFFRGYGNPSERPFVLALGSRARHKNLALLVTAADALAEIGVDLVVAGDGGAVFAAANLYARPNVHLLGRVTDDDLAYLLERALCLAFPSFAEGFGLPIVEAMARGCPVVASNCASMPEVCGPAALLASPFDAVEWIGHIRALKESPDLASDLVGRGLERVKLFSWQNTAEGYLSLLQSPSRHLSSYGKARPAKPRIAAVFATRGRPEIVSRAVKRLLQTQSLKPIGVIVSCAEPSDAGDLAVTPGVRVLTGPSGLAAQRNTALRDLPPDTEIVAFFDDDFIADSEWLATAGSVFRDESRIAAFTGRVVADGIKGPGIGFDEAVRLLESASPDDRTWAEPYSPYGCNMAFRVAAVRGMRFDERLVLYSWLEDRDFAATLAKNGGRCVKAGRAYGVHMGAKSGRISGERLGYSQIVNPLYMLRKGTMTIGQAADQILRNLVSNFGRLVWPEPFIDRRGRVRGNLIAFRDVLNGRLEPERAATLPKRTIRSTELEVQAK